jgi:hypothetical protein
VKIRELLRANYPPPAYACFDEVPETTGGRAFNRADLVVVGLWPSRGMEITGIEIKASRSDWLRELKNPKKAEAVFRFCDRWILATTSEEIVKGDELPPLWGLVTVKSGKLSWRVVPGRLKAEPPTVGFFASLCRKAAEDRDAVRANWVPAAEVQARVNQELATWKKIEGDRLARARFPEIAELEALRREVAMFQEATGVEIRNYGARREIADALRAHREGRLKVQAEGQLEQTKALARSLQEVGARIEKEATALEASRSSA